MTATKPSKSTYVIMVLAGMLITMLTFVWATNAKVSRPTFDAAVEKNSVEHKAIEVDVIELEKATERIFIMQEEVIKKDLKEIKELIKAQ